MTAFHVGQEVVCVDDSSVMDKAERFATPNFIVLGKHYIIRDFVEFDYLNEVAPALYLEGVIRVYQGGTGENAKYNGVDWPFGAYRFRPIDQSKLAVFRRMCISNKPLVPVE